MAKSGIHAKIRPASKPKIKRYGAEILKNKKSEPAKQSIFLYKLSPAQRPIAIVVAVVVLVFGGLYIAFELIPPSPYDTTDGGGTDWGSDGGSGGGGVVDNTQLSATITDAYCVYAGTDGVGFPLYTWGTTGTGSGPVGAYISVGDRVYGEDRDTIEQAIECNGWSLPGNFECMRTESSPSSFTWSSYYSANFNSGTTREFIVYGRGAGNSTQILATATATCPDYGNYPSS